MPTKLTNAGNQQEYIPAGNGDASGEYAGSSSVSTATSKKGKEYNPRGSSLKAGDSISYKKDTKYGGERKKGKIASIDGNTITTTDGEKVNKFNAFKEEKKKPVQKDEDDWGKWADKTDKEVPSNWKSDGFDGNTRFYNVDNKDGLQIEGASVRPDGSTTLYTENASLSFGSLKEATDFLSITDKDKALKTLLDRGWLGEAEEEAVNDMFKNNTKTYETGNIGYHKGYGIDYNIYGGGEFSVQVDGDDVMFKTEQEAKDFINDLVKNPEYRIPDLEDETYGVDDDYIRSYGPVPDKEEYPKEHQEYMDSYNKWLKNGEREPIDEDVEVDLDYERSHGVIPDPEEEPEEYKKYIDTYKKWKENGGSFETPEQPKAQPQESNAVKKLKGLGLKQSEIDEIIAELTGKKSSKLPF